MYNIIVKHENIATCFNYFKRKFNIYSGKLQEYSRKVSKMIVYIINWHNGNLIYLIDVCKNIYDVTC